MTKLLTYKFTVTKEELMDAMRTKNRGPELEDAKDARIAKLETRVKELEGCVDDAETHSSIVSNHLVVANDRIADLERQLADATTWRSPETAPMDGQEIIGLFKAIDGGRFVKSSYFDRDCDIWEVGLYVYDELLGWLPLPETKKEDV